MHQIITEDAHTIATAPLDWEGLAGKTVLISGANGYVPQFFVHGLLARNDLHNAKIKVIALCRNKQRASERFGEYLNRDDFQLLIQDVCEPLSGEIKADYFIHAASPAGFYGRNEKPVSTFNANVIGTKNMLDCAVANHALGFLLVSSVDVYGLMPTGERLKESDIGILDSLNVRNAYACGKRAAEAMAICYKEQYALPIIIARPFQIIGAGIALDDGRLHADFVSQILSSGKIVLKGDGSAKRTFMYISDAIIGMMTAMLNGISGEAYNIVDEKGEANVLELAKLMASLVSSHSVMVEFDESKRDLPEVKHALSIVIGSSEKLRSLGWQPKVSLKVACERLLEYYEAR
jgi:nucleoside-diphosphate-sugar epimerase